MGPPKTSVTSFCHRCENAKVLRNARYKCLNCKEKMCSECAKNHMILRPCYDFRIIDLQSAKSVDSVFSIEPDEKPESKDTSSKVGDIESLKSSESTYQVKRTFGKPVLQLSMQKSNRIMIPIPNAFRSSTQTIDRTLPSDRLSDKKRAEVLQHAETVMQSGEYNENGDFYPNSSISEQKTKASILKRTTSFKSEEANGLWNIETPNSNSKVRFSDTQLDSMMPKKAVRFSKSTITEEPTGIMREYSNNFYQILGKGNSKTISETKPIPEPVKKMKRQIAAGISMVSQFSIVIKPNESAGKISSILFLNDIYLVVIDRVNYKMKIFDSRERYRMVIDKKIPKGSWGMASPEDNIIAMTCRNKIIFYGLFESKTPRYEKPKDPVIQPLGVEYRIRASCYGITFCESRDLFFIACNVFFSDPSIFIVDTKGFTQHIIRTIDDGMSPTIPFSETLALDSDRGVLYIGDRVGKRIVCITYEGKHIWNVPLLGKPVSLTFDNEFIYACLNGRIISVVHKDGRFIRNIICLDLDGRRICFHESQNQLIVLTKAFWGVSHFIQIYQL